MINASHVCVRRQIPEALYWSSSLHRFMLRRVKDYTIPFSTAVFLGRKEAATEDCVYLK